ncbi:uncharacterized protein DDB_G0284459 [Drosophila virilis]|uniref:Uncharacterized protein, isoform A n=1 Tax=Drosophila virilis TaxID=7244 RepID=B4MC03_DROVI|nr:cell wall protein DAN4 [Drosophila virilis]XP_015024956.1 cell wall protein DAN4 [Drosophila virilis]EDW58624.1 uncharacterized protein Dvir_GJ14541, isoform A [Drosophila virilis]KRF78367.1 uncharacterized protein Dvir_GJ14541, isoform B [Drosophila virilis]
MLSKMAQPNNLGGGGGAPASGGRRVPMSLTGAGAGGTTVSRLQQSNGRSNSPQNSNVSKKNESNISMGPFIALKKSSVTQSRSPSTSSTASTSSSSSSAPKDDEKGQNGINKSTNSNQKSAQNGSSNTQAVREQQKPKEKQTEKKEPVKPEVKDEAAKPDKSETKPNAPPSVEAKTEVAAAAAAAKNIEAAATKKVEPAAVEVIDLVNEPEVAAAVPNTPNSERKSSRRVAAAGQQKSPSKPQQSDSPSSKKQPEEAEQKPEAVEDVEMEPLTVDASPIRHHVASTQPTATSTPGRNLFGFRSSKPTNEVELAAQPSSSPATAPARSFAQISGRRSIRPTATLTPGKLGSYRCVNSDLDTSSCTNTSMNATVGSEIPNSSSFSFSFFGRGRKRERTPPPLTGTQSANDLAQDVEMSPPKRARFDLFSLNLASPFTMLRSRFSKTTISTPSTRQTPPAGDDDDVGGVQNVSGTINQEEEQQQLNKSSGSDEVTVGQEAGLETPKKSGTPAKDVVLDENVEGEGADAVANLAADVPAEGEGANRSRCAIM